MVEEYKENDCPRAQLLLEESADQVVLGLRPRSSAHASHEQCIESSIGSWPTVIARIIVAHLGLGDDVFVLLEAV